MYGDQHEATAQLAEEICCINSITLRIAPMGIEQLSDEQLDAFESNYRKA